MLDDNGFPKRESKLQFGIFTHLGQAAGIAQDNRMLVLDKGEKIYQLMHRDKIMKDHKFRMRTYPNSFTGYDLVTWLVEKNEVADSDEALRMSQALLENGILHHSNEMTFALLPIQ